MTNWVDFSRTAWLKKTGQDTKGAVSLKKEQQRKEKVIERIQKGFRAEGHPYFAIFPTHEVMETSLFLSLFFSRAQETGKNQFLIEATASHGILELFKKLKKVQAQAALISPDQSGRVSLEHLRQKMGPKSLMFAHRLYHPVLGSIEDQMHLVASLLKEHDVLYYLDVTKALGERFFDLESIDADYIGFDLSTLDFELKGSILFSKTPIENFFIAPLDLDYSFYEKMLEAFEQFYEKATEQLLQKIQTKMRFDQLIKEAIPEVEYLIPQPQQSVSSVLIHFPKVHAEALHYGLVSQRIATDLGGGNEQQVSGLLELLSVESSKARSSLGFHFTDLVNDTDMMHFISVIQDQYKILLKGAL